MKDDLISGITGNWWDGTAFTISFQDDDDYAPVYQNVMVITPEPISLTLFAFWWNIFLKENTSNCFKKEKPYEISNIFISTIVYML